MELILQGKDDAFCIDSKLFFIGIGKYLESFEGFCLGDVTALSEWSKEVLVVGRVVGVGDGHTL